MDVSVVSVYLETRKHRAELEKRFSRLKMELSTVQAKETELSTKVDPDSLVTAKSVKVINTQQATLNTQSATCVYCGIWFSLGNSGVSSDHLADCQLLQGISVFQPVNTGWTKITESLSSPFSKITWAKDTR